MYSNCIFCQRDLGTNESLPAFPVGERLAYDPQKGRLWVVCRGCARWNLTPLEERWEAIDEAERQFERARIRGGSGEIALARLADGTDLVRVGAPHRTELALWRYGDFFKRRRKQQIIIAGSVMAGGGLALAGALTAGLGIVSAFQIGHALHVMTQEGAPWSTVARLRTPKGNILRVRPTHLKRTEIGTTESGELRLKIHTARPKSVRAGAGLEYEGLEAQRVLGKLLPGVNRLGGTQDEIEFAVSRIENAGNKGKFFESVARSGPALTALDRKRSWAEKFSTGDPEKGRSTGLFALPRTLSLAIEMAAHEEQERIALEEDISVLEAAWREAEEIAKIADDMFLPPEVDDRLDSLRKRTADR